ncbi:MAG: alanine racemase [Aggregatilineales bacterium]
MQISELDTPSVVIDLDKMEANIARMQAHCDSLGIKFRPHIKTHKIPEIARMQLDAGAVGIACQKVSEAEVFAEAGITDIQIPYNIVGQVKARRLIDLATYNRVTVAADHISVIAGLADAAKTMDINVRVLVDVATHIKRTGAKPHEVVTLAKRIEEEVQLHFAGLMIYPSDPEDRPALQEAMDSLNRAGIGVDVVSGGGFGAALKAAEIPELTEIRVGTYVFGDWRSAQRGWMSLDDCAMTVRTMVVNRPDTDRAILDGGGKTFTPDSHNGLYGHIVEYPDARIYQLSEEHGHVDLSQCNETPVIGEVVNVIPVHTCLVTNMFDTIYGVRGEEVEKEWKVAARGKVW